MQRILRIAVGCLVVAFCQWNCQAPIPAEGLQLWLKADADVTLNGSAVGRWADQSGNGNDAIQADVRRQPLIVRNELNGLPVVRFDGNDDRLALTGTAVMSQLTLFIVMRIDSGAIGPNPNFPVGLGDADGKGRVFFLGMPVEAVLDTSDVIYVGGGLGVGVRAILPGCAAFGRWNSISVTVNQTIWNTKLRANGRNASIAPYGKMNMSLFVPLGSPTGTGTGGIGGADGVSVYAVGRVVAKCDIAEVIVYNIVLSDSARRSIEQYLETKYNLPQAGEDR